jgi:hypothetical protein
MEGSKISTLGMIRSGALFASLCLAGAGWAQQGADAPAAGGTGSAEHDHAGAGSSGGGADHGAMGHGGGMGHGGMGCQEMMGHGGGAGGGHEGGGGCMGGHQGGAEGGHGGGMMGGMGGMMGAGGMGGMMGGMGGMMGHGGQGGMDHGGGMMMGHMMCRTTEHVDGRLAYLKAELKLADAQTTQWNAFADAIRAATQKAGQFCASMHEQPASGASTASGGLIAQLGMMERMMSVHLEEVRTVKTATESLFGVLSDEQKKTADQTISGMMGFGMTMGGMGKM